LASSSRYIPPFANAFNGAGATAPGNVLTFWVSGGSYSTPKSAYTDSGLTVPITTITAGADGKYANIFLGSGDYGIQERNSDGVLLWSADPVAAALTTAASTSAAGVIEIATTAEALLATSSVLAMTPATTAQSIQQGFSLGAAGGTGNALTGTPTITPIALADGMRASLRAPAGNFAATTLNWAGLGIVAVKVKSATGPIACVGEETTTNNMLDFEYSASDAAWILLNPRLTGTWPKGYLNGLELSRSSATVFGIAAGVCRNEDSGTARDMTLAASITKSLSAFAAGSGNGGLDTGAVANATWYHVHLIRKDSDGTIDALYSTSVAAPTMPSGYTARRRIGSFLTNGAAQIVAFSQVGDEFLWDVALVDIDATNPGTAAVSRTLTVPLGVKVLAIIDGGVYGGTNQPGANFSSLDVSDQAAQAATTAALTLPISQGGAIAGGPNTMWTMSRHHIRTNTSSQIRSRLSASGAADHIGIITRGWIDSRGK
jgi:hypothetical protein